MSCFPISERRLQRAADHAFAGVLEGAVNLTVFLPEEHESAPLPLLILLHGVDGEPLELVGAGERSADRAGDGARRRDSAVRDCDALGWAAGDGTAYLPHREFDAEKWIAEDVPECLGELLPAVRTERFYLAGLSMGGYGALRLGMKYARK